MSLCFLNIYHSHVLVLTMISEMCVFRGILPAFGFSDKKLEMVQCVGKGRMGRARGICGMRYLVCFVRIFVSIYLHIRSPILVPLPARTHHLSLVPASL